MLYKIIIISLLAIIILLAIIVNIRRIPQIESFGIEEEGHPTDEVKIKLQINGSSWTVWHNDSLLGSGGNTGESTVNYDIKKMRFYDTIKIRVKTGSDKGGIIGYIKADDTTYVTNKDNFKISGQYVGNDGKGLGDYSGGKYLGCFGDEGPVSYGGNNGTVNCAFYCANPFSIWTPPKNSKCVSGTVNGVADSKWCNQLVGFNKGLSTCQCSPATSQGRALPNYLGHKSISECHKAAVDSKQIYYALQNGGECWTGSSYAKYGTKPANSCGARCGNDGGNHSYCGGPYVNQVYSTVTPPEMLEFTDTSIRERASDIPANALWILPKQGDLANTWPDGTWEYVWTNNPPSKIKFCNYPEFVEYQPSACTDSSDSMTCYNSVKPNYQVDVNKCRRHYQAPAGLDTDEFFKIVNRAYRKSTKYYSGENSAQLEEFLDTMSETYTAACLLLIETSDTAYYDGLCQKRKEKLQHDLNNACKDMPLSKRIGPSDIPSSYQQCQPGTIECQLLKEQCNGKNYCFDDKSASGPRCYIPPKMSRYAGLNSPDFYSAVTKAAQLIQVPKYKNGNAGARFKKLVDNLLDLARTVEFNTGDKKDCNCRKDLNDPTGLTCYPC